MAKTDFKMTDYNQNNKIVSAFKDQESPGSVRRKPHKYHVWYFGPNVLHEEDISVNQMILCLSTLPKKSKDVIANVLKKPHNFVRKKQ